MVSFVPRLFHKFVHFLQHTLLMTSLWISLFVPINKIIRSLFLTVNGYFLSCLVPHYDKKTKTLQIVYSEGVVTDFFCLLSFIVCFGDISKKQFMKDDTYTSIWEGIVML